MNPIQKEFVEAGLDYIRSLVKTMNASPIYKIFPTKAYKDYVKMVHRIHAAGVCFNNSCCCFCCKLLL